MSESIDDSVQLPYCLGCGYRLTGVNHFRCPECGRAFDPDDPTSYRSASEGEPDPGEKARIEKQKTNISWLILIGLALVIVSISLLGKPSKTTPGGPAPDDGGISITTVVLVGVGVLIVGFFALWWIGGQWLMSMQERVRVLSQEQSHEKTLALLERMCSSRHPGAFIIRLWCPGYFEVGVAKQLADMDRPEEAMQWLAKSDRK